MRKKIFYQVFRGKRYRIRFTPTMGGDYAKVNAPDDCDKEMVIALDKNKDPKCLLNSFCHESLHALFWDLSEDAVTESADSIANFLWALGYRRK